MKNSKVKLPAKTSQTLYYYKKGKNQGFQETTSTATDATTTCTTVLTTTH